MSDPLVMDTSQVAALLGISENTVYRLGKSGELPSVKIGRKRKFFYKDVVAWLERKRDGQEAQK